MSQPVYDPNRRQHYSFSRHGENVVVEIRAMPGGDAPSHLHPAQEERWTVLEGEVRFTVGGQRVVPQPGVEVVIPAGVKHSFKNVGKGEARIRAEVIPGGAIEPFLTEGAEMARAGYYTRHGLITSLTGARKVSAFVKRYEDTAVILWPPRFVQRLLALLSG